MLDLITQYIPPEALTALATLAAAIIALLKAFALVVTSATVCVRLLEHYVPRMREWALKTRTTTDNVAVEEFATFLAVAAPKLDWLAAKLEWWAGNRKANEAIAKIAKGK